MSAEVYLGFDFGTKKMGVAVGQAITATAEPLPKIAAKEGVPDWQIVAKHIITWNPKALIVGLPTCINGEKLYTTDAATSFAKELEKRFKLPVYLVDERLSTVEARSYVFEQGGYKKLRKANIDSIAACIILEQWLRTSPTLR